MDFFYQPYLLKSDVAQEPYFELDISRLYPANPNENLNWFDFQNFNKNLFYNYLKIPIIVQSVLQDDRHNLYIKGLIKENIINAFDRVFTQSEKKKEYLYLAQDVLDLVTNNKFDIYDASSYFEKYIQDKSNIFYIEAYENEYLFTPSLSLINQVETEEERLLIEALSRRVLFLKELGVLEFIISNWKIKGYNLENYDTGLSEILSIFMDATSTQLRNVLKDINKDPAEKAKQELRDIWDKIKISKKI